jgi:hypothetical protein
MKIKLAKNINKLSKNEKNKWDKMQNKKGVGGR